MSRKRAIQNALGRLGMQASPKQVVAALADFGIDVTEGLVRRVKVEMLEETAKAERQRLKIPDYQRRIHRPPKTPPHRGSRS
jgi:hypothetical protein